MRFSLLPKVLAASLTDLSPARLRKLGVSVLLLDFDNTVVPYTTSQPTAEMLAWFRQMADHDVRLCVVSNSHKDRVQDFCDQQGLPCIRAAAKPSTKGLRAAMAQLGATPETTAMVGDQIFTDVLAGNRAGVLSVLVKPIHLSNVFLKLRHLAEKPFIAAAKRRGTL
jgi:hypothetical protein